MKCMPNNNNKNNPIPVAYSSWKSEASLKGIFRNKWPQGFSFEGRKLAPSGEKREDPKHFSFPLSIYLTFLEGHFLSPSLSLSCLAGVNTWAS